MVTIVSYTQLILILALSVSSVQLLSSSQVRYKREQNSFVTTIIIGNQFTSKAELYELTFNCNASGCQPLPLQEHDLIWSSPDTPGISEVKYVIYQGQTAILTTTGNGAIVYSYPNGTVLFHKEFDTSTWINVHSAEILPDGNVIVAGSLVDGIFAVLYPDGNNVIQQVADTVSATARFGHSLVYDKERNRLYAAGYLTLYIIEYSSGSDGRGVLKLVQNVSLDTIYDEPNKNEDSNIEDGVHDLYPVDGSTDTLWLTTGEHVFTINVTDFTIAKYENLYTVDSQHSEQRNVAVPKKGGIKVISSDGTSGLILAKSAPWFKEWFSSSEEGYMDQNYNPYTPIVLWSLPNNGSDALYCSHPDYDITNQCKINFDLLEPIWFYKARIFSLQPFSY